MRIRLRAGRMKCWAEEDGDAAISRTPDSLHLIHRSGAPIVLPFRLDTARIQAPRI